MCIMGLMPDVSKLVVRFLLGDGMLISTKDATCERQAWRPDLPVAIPKGGEQRRWIVEALVENRHRYIAYLMTRVGDQAIAQDLFQDLCVRAIERSSSLRDSDLASHWLYRVMYSVLIDYLRSNKARTQREGMYAIESHVLQGDIDTPDEEMKTCSCAALLLEKLSPEDRTLLQKIDMLDEPRDVVAQGTGISRQTLRVRLHRARQALRSMVLRTCGECSDTGFRECEC